MARHESDREDLLREATALVARAEIALAGQAEPLVAGFRRDGAASFYFGADPVVQFDPGLRVRRGFFGGQLLKAEGGRLVALVRQRTPAETQLLRHEWSEEQTHDYLANMRSRLAELQQQLESGEAQVIGAVPSAGEVVPKLRNWLAELPLALAVAAAAGLR